jgi:hypothetical protein
MMISGNDPRLRLEEDGIHNALMLEKQNRPLDSTVNSLN